MESKIENIIRNKKYFELNGEEKELIEEWASNEVEFDQLKAVFSSVDDMNSSAKEALNPTVKQRLDVRFKEKYANRRLVWYNRLWLFLWPRDVSVVRKPLLHFATIGVVIAIVIPFLYIEGPSKESLAMNEKQTEQPETYSESDDETVTSDTETSEKVNSDKSDLHNEQVENQLQKKDREDNFKIDNDQQTRVRDMEMTSPKEKSLDQIQMDQNLSIEDEVTESEADIVNDASVVEEVSMAEQPVFAGTVSGGVKDSKSNAMLDADEISDERVETKETLNLLTTLY